MGIYFKGYCKRTRPLYAYASYLQSKNRGQYQWAKFARAMVAIKEKYTRRNY